MTEPTPLQKAAMIIQKLRSDLEAQQSARHEPLAIIGIGCRLPGGVESPEQYWRLLVEGREAIVDVPPMRWSRSRWLRTGEAQPGKMYTTLGGYVEGVADFDPAPLGIAPREVPEIEPQQRLALEVAWRAVEDAGLCDGSLRGSATGVFVGLGGNDYGQMHPGLSDPGALSAWTLTGHSASMASGRISYLLGLKGPSLTVDTACSASLVSTHLAMRSLRAGECDLALSIGTSAMLSPVGHTMLCQMSALARDGRSKAFDARADGYGRGEGAGAVILKRLSDALRDGDFIYAVVRGSAVNQDGASSGLTAPNGPAQEAVIRAALSDARVRAEDISYVEAHGTGTPLGDPIEIGALHNSYGRARAPGDPLLVASAKSNIGHLEAAAGIAGLIKCALMLRHGLMPPHVHFEQPSRAIAWDSLNVRVNTKLREWPLADPGGWLIGLSGFGMSGTNAHLILQSFSPPAAPRAAVASSQHQASSIPRSSAAAVHWLGIAAYNRAAFKELVKRHVGAVGSVDEVDLASSCAIANQRRCDAPYRLGVWGADRPSLRAALHDASEGVPGAWVAGHVERAPTRLALLFSGQGAQYTGMGEQLWQRYAEFREPFDACARVYEELRGGSLHESMWSGDLQPTQEAQPGLYALQVSLLELWRSFGLEAQIAVGHSVGEIAACYAAGLFSLEDGMRVACERGRLMGALPAGGAMLSVFACEQEVAAYLQGGVEVAAVNSPTETILSGSSRAVDAVAAALGAAGVNCRRLRVSHAFHSQQMQPVRAELESVIEGTRTQALRLELVSTVTGRTIGAEALAQPSYWSSQLRSPVRFLDAVRLLMDQGVGEFLEVGPHCTLRELVAASSPEGMPVRAWASQQRGQDQVHSIERCRSDLWCTGYAMRPRRRSAQDQERPLELPRYPLQRQSYWLPAAVPGDPTAEVHPAASDIHPWLTRRLPTAELIYESCWKPDASSQLTASTYRELSVLELAWIFSRIACHEYHLAGVRIEHAHLADPITSAADTMVRLQWTLQGNSDAALGTLHLLDDAGGWHRVGSCHIVAEPEQTFTTAAPTTARAPSDVFFDVASEVELAPERAWRRLGAERISGWNRLRAVQTARFPAQVGPVRQVLADSSSWTFWGKHGCVAAFDGIQLESLTERAHGSLAAGIPGGDLPAQALGSLRGGLVDWVVDYGHQERWLAAPHTWRADLPPGLGRWLVITSDATTQAPLVARLRSLGLDIAERSLAQLWSGVNDGARAERRLDGVLSELDVGGYERIVHLWPSDPRQERPWAAGLGLLKSLRALSVTTPNWWFVDSASPQSRALSGLLGVSALELPALWGGMVELDGGVVDAIGETALRWIVRQVALPGNQSREERIRVGGEKLRVARLTRAEPVARDLVVTPIDAGPALVFGSLPRLGARCVELMNELGITTVVAVGWQAPSTWTPPAGIELLQMSLQQYVDAPLPVSSVLVLGDAWETQPIEQLDISELDKRCTRALGELQRLADHVPRTSLTAFHVFASIAPLLGSGGMATSAAIHAGYAATVDRLRGAGVPVAITFCSQWCEGEQLPELSARQSAHSGVGGVPLAAGIWSALRRRAGAGEDGGDSTVLAAIDWKRYRPVWELLRNRCYLSELSDAHIDARSNLAPLLPELQQADASERLGLVVRFLQNMLTEILEQPEPVEPRRGFFELGLDSMMAVELNKRVSDATGKALGATATFDHPNVEALSLHLLRDHLALEVSDTTPGVAEQSQLTSLDETELVSLLEAEMLRA